MKKINIALLGLGTVGSGVYEILTQHPQVEIPFVVVNNPDKKRNIPLKASTTVSDNSTIDNLLKNPEIDIVIEVMGGDTLAYQAIKGALQNKKHVITANKVVIAKFGKELFEIANQQGVNLLFEAGVAGGIPIILPLKQSLLGNKVKRMAGILNGTCNYILTKMEQEAMEFDVALKLAQKMGFAEADPAADIEGTDAACKIAILAGLVEKTAFRPENIFTEGIKNISALDIEMAKELGYTIRLIGLYQASTDKADVRVHPMLIPKTHPLASIYNENNAIWLNGSAVGDLMFYGKGAGKMPTASAVCGDTLLLIEALLAGEKAVETMRFTLEKNQPLQAIGETENSYYIRLSTADQPGVVGHIGQACGNHNVSLSALIQKPVLNCNESATIVLLTHQVKESDLQAALKEIEAKSSINSICTVIRVMEAL